MSTILVVDADSDVALDLAPEAARAGHRLLREPDARRARDRIRRVSPDILIIDAVFPDDPSEGLNLARWLKQSPTLNAIPVLVVADRAELEACGLRVGPEPRGGGWLVVEAFLDKPISGAHLMQEVSALL